MCSLYLLLQDYGKYGVVDMDDKQRLFKLLKRLNTDPIRGSNSSSNDRGLQTPCRNARREGAGKDTTVDSLEAKLRAQMLDGNAALLSLADDSDDYLLQVRQISIVDCSLSGNLVALSLHQLRRHARRAQTVSLAC